VDTSDWATVELTINDKPPELESLSRLNDPGQSVEFTLSMSDPDDPGQVVDWEEMWSDGISPPKRRYQVNLVKEPSFSKKDENHNAVGYGIFLDVAGQITYVPEGNYNTFKDTFTVTVEDNKCDVTSKQATFTITYPNDETSAGSGGSLGWAMLGGLILLLRRRVAA
ncbi:MYXO-CTERM sorting domain-containing protein, partial [Alcanivorax sp. HI0044]